LSDDSPKPVQASLEVKRRLLKRTLERIAPAVVALVVWLTYRTTRRVLVNWHAVEMRQRRGEHAIIATWHNNIAYLVAFLGLNVSLDAITSKSRDGDLIARIARAFGMGAVRGSSSRGALSALRESLRVLKSRWVGITPDGPRGPRYVLQAGAPALAQLSGAPLIPIVWASRRFWQFGSWDRMRLPKPFSTVVILMGDPIFVNRDEDTEQARQRIELAMRKLSRDADRFVGGTLTDQEPLLNELEDSVTPAD
jgi:hypothetical protein